MQTQPDLKFLFVNWAERVRQLVADHPLQIISWEATRRCNLSCAHCGSPAEEVTVAEELTTGEVIGAFEQIASDFAMQQFRHVNITGGEPFLRLDLLDILKSISKYPFYRNIDIQTNGFFIADSPQILDKLIIYGVTGLGISIDGLESSHDSFRRRKGAFKKAFTAATLSVKHGYIVTVSVVAHAKNVDEIPALFQLVREKIGPRVFRVMFIDHIGRARLGSDYALSADQIKQVIEFLRTAYKKGCATYADPKSTMVELGCGGWTGCELEGTIRPFIFHCIAGINNLGILFDGKLASCSNISRDFIEGDFRKERIKEVWENRYRRYRDFEWKKTSECVNCDQWNYCQGGPMHLRLSNRKMIDCIYCILKGSKPTSAYCAMGK